MIQQINIVTYRNQLEVAPLKNLFFLAVEGFVMDSIRDKKEIERMGKTFPTI